MLQPHEGSGLNILIIFTDQQQRDTLGAYGQRIARTPNLDRLASQSLVFDNAICAQPVCTPSRGSLVTGVYPHTHGCVINSMVRPGYYDIELPETVATLAEHLGPHGHAAGYVGKWHVGREVVPQHGFQDYWVSTEDEYTRQEDIPERGHCGYYHYLVEQGYAPASDDPHPFFTREQTAELPEQHSRIAFITREAERFLETRQDRDFVLIVNYLEPHPPYHGPTDGMYDPADVTLPVNLYAEPVSDMPERARLFQRFSTEMTQSGEGPFACEAPWRDLFARYCGLVTLADKYVGRLLDKLAALSLDADTLVVFTSDHGDMMGSHGMINKCVMYDEALRVPFLVRHPGFPGNGRHVEEVVSLVDVVPTALAAVGVGPSGDVQGEDLMPLIRQERAQDPAKPGFAEWNGRLQWMHARHDMFAPVADRFIRTARTRDWKLNVNPGDVSELYDLRNDPGEMRNLIHNPAHRDVVYRLLGELRQWQERTGDTIDLEM